jgi:hypothetical protein
LEAHDSEFTVVVKNIEKKSGDASNGVSPLAEKKKQ